MLLFGEYTFVVALKPADASQRDASSRLVIQFLETPELSQPLYSPGQRVVVNSDLFKVP